MLQGHPRGDDQRDGNSVFECDFHRVRPRAVATGSERDLERNLTLIWVKEPTGRFGCVLDPVATARGSDTTAKRRRGRRTPKSLTANFG